MSRSRSCAHSAGMTEPCTRRSMETCGNHRKMVSRWSTRTRNGCGKDGGLRRSLLITGILRAIRSHDLGVIPGGFTQNSHDAGGSVAAALQSSSLSRFRQHEVTKLCPDAVDSTRFSSRVNSEYSSSRTLATKTGRPIKVAVVVEQFRRRLRPKQRAGERLDKTTLHDFTTAR
jgi:hypothetical protein